MLRIYCTDMHRARGALCGDCADLAAYADARLGKCPYGDDKPSCKQCPIHCYRPDRRVTIQEVMRYAGPKMLFRHPWLAITHLWLDKRSAGTQKPPPRRVTPTNSKA
jgi:hypothetical protein